MKMARLQKRDKTRGDEENSILSSIYVRTPIPIHSG